MKLPNEKRYRVLVVDNDRDTLQGIDAVLAGDVDVVTCSSPGDALRLMTHQRFQVLCTDYDMPGMNGLELIAQAEMLPGFVGCLLLTGDADYARTTSAGDHYVLLKPYDPGRLIGLVLQIARLAQFKNSSRSSQGKKP